MERALIDYRDSFDDLIVHHDKKSAVYWLSVDRPASRGGRAALLHLFFVLR